MVLQHTVFSHRLTSAGASDIKGQNFEIKQPVGFSKQDLICQLS